MIETVRVQGFRSLADVELTGLSRAAVLIGANGSGKSNLMRFFEMLSWMVRSQRLGEFVALHGGADDQLYGGNRLTPRLEAEIGLRTLAGLNDYRFALAYAQPDRFIFVEESFRFSRFGIPTKATWQNLGSSHQEARIVEAAQTQGFKHDFPGVNTQTAQVIVKLLRNCSIYQFHDTSDSSNFKTRWDRYDNNFLRANGGNLAAILYRLEQEDFDRYNLICRHIGRILPEFSHFAIEENYGRVLLQWKAKGMDKVVGAHLTSDGSLRFFALVTLLHLPPEMLPGVILLDEPELGLHPVAIRLVGELIQSLATERQVIVATQSPLLVDTFDLDNVFVLEWQDSQTKFRKINPEEYQVWLDDSFAPGDLWQKNLLGGRP